MQCKLHRPHPVARPAARLFVFHHAGGSSYSYVSWHRFLPSDWELCLVDLPGRGVNARLPLVHTLDEAVTAALASIEPYTDVPFAWHGHSAGGLVAYAALRAWLEAGRGLPFWLGVSSSKPPSHPHADGEAAILSLSDDDLLADLKRFGGAPEGLALSPELLASFLSLFRADVGAVLSSRYTPLAEPLPIPITGFAATRDTFAPPSEIERWSSETRPGAFSMHVFEGDHFFVFSSSQAAFLERLVGEANAALFGFGGFA